MITTRYQLTPVPFTAVQFSDPFWAPRIETNRAATIPHVYRKLEGTGRVSAFDLNFERPVPSPVVLIFGDSDPAKWIEAASYSLATHPDPKLAGIVDRVVDKVIAAQQDGYLNTHFTRAQPEMRWKNLRDWHELSSNASTREKLRDIYGRLDMVDTMIGLLAETPPAGFGFSDTAFRVFILMATRRLQSDRFLTVDFRPEVYSPLGIDWVAKTDMRSIILRHAPELAPALSRAGSPFAPWHLMPPQSSRSQVALV